MYMYIYSNNTRIVNSPELTLLSLVCISSIGAALVYHKKNKAARSLDNVFETRIVS